MPESTNGADPTVIGLVTQGLAEVKEAVTQLSRDLHGTLARLPNDYVPRREVERWRDERTIEVGSLRVDLAAERNARVAAIRELAEQRDADEHEREEREEALDRQRTADRRWFLGMVVTIILAVFTAAVTLIVHWL